MRRRSTARALAVWAGIGGTGAAIGAVIGGVLTQLGGWRWAFLVNAPVGLIIGVLVLLIIRRAMLAEPTYSGRPTHPIASILRLLRTRSVIGGATAGFAIVWLLPYSLPALVVGVSFAALGIGPVLVTATTTATAYVSHDESGTASGVVNTVHEIGGDLDRFRQ